MGNPYDKMLAALLEVDTYLDERADADQESSQLSPVPNEEMRLLIIVRDALGKAIDRDAIRRDIQELEGMHAARDLNDAGMTELVKLIALEKATRRPI